jgi:hypothetical protein
MFKIEVMILITIFDIVKDSSICDYPLQFNAVQFGITVRFNF